MQNHIKKEQEKLDKYNDVDIFKKKNYSTDAQEEKELITETAIVEYKNETWFKKILNFFKSIFKK